MSSEQFDKKIKSKLEEVQPPYREQAWKNFKSLLPAPWYVALFQQYGSWLYSAVGTVAIVTTSYLYYQENKENKQLHAKISTLQSQIAQSETTSTLPSAKIPWDTVPAVPPKQPAQLVQTEIQEVPAVERLDIKTKAKANRFSPLAPSNQTTDKGKLIGNATKRISAPKITPNKVAESFGPAKSNQGSAVKGNAEITVPAATDSIQTPALDGTTVTQQKDPAVLPKSPPDSSATTAKTDSTHSPPAPETIKPEKSSRISLVQARVGLHSDFNGFRKVAVGPVFEVFLGRNISLNAGLLFSSPEERRLPLPRDFNMATGRRFEDQYRKHIPRNDRLQGIVVNTSVVQLPLTFHYYVPVNERLSFMALAGTQLNVSVYQTVEFRSFFAGEEQLNKFETRYKTQTFNNLYYGVGLQYKFGRLVGQLNPYLQTFYREPDYFNQSKKFGLNAALKFNLKK
ncbi:hypothetical protein AHMF7605_06545 [Adhaeribacter arboris]|uniref:Outer membrane protein beta-barrel domain-containing protein n=1 Tax=Adhaeribacter arboris TaxID=2072846 RepID=A0A2T2YCF9_9BACT|nr:hypothetical protein [Adhaeribacter arboris]PSR53211.1 hypothetical protein AHMF7605_06545 [Adhaeribacter arboris]